MSGMTSGVKPRRGCVASASLMSFGRPARNSPRQFIVRGIFSYQYREKCMFDVVGRGRTPLNPIHFNPISRINSARYTLSSFDFDSETSLCN